MDLKKYQRQLRLTLKKYLSLVSSKQECFHEKSFEREYLEILREIILIHEKQKIEISNLRLLRAKSASNNSCQVSRNVASPPNENYAGTETLPLDPTVLQRKEELPGLQEGVLRTDAGGNFMAEGDPRLDLLNDLDECSFEGALKKEDDPVSSQNTGEENISDQEQPEKSPRNSPAPYDEWDDIHELVTAYEFMQSLGLLTIKECEEVLSKRRERHKRNAYSHVFCQAIWEKQETKRKKRDWLLSSSPPQLRRKVRPGSHPPSRQHSRPSSPLEGGSSSPPSSLSPPSPISPGPFSQNCEEICPTCKEKGASFQCDGCGVLFHSSCVDCPDDEKDSFSEWLCSKCESLGLRAALYTDPLHQTLSTKGNEGSYVN